MISWLIFTAAGGWLASLGWRSEPSLGAGGCFIVGHMVLIGCGYFAGQHIGLWR